MPKLQTRILQRNPSVPTKQGGTLEGSDRGGGNLTEANHTSFHLKKPTKHGQLSKELSSRHVSEVNMRAAARNNEAPSKETTEY